MEIYLQAVILGEMKEVGMYESQCTPRIGEKIQLSLHSGDFIRKGRPLPYAKDIHFRVTDILHIGFNMLQIEEWMTPYVNTQGHLLVTVSAADEAARDYLKRLTEQES